MKRFCALVGSREPLSGYSVNALINAGCPPDCVVVDAKAPSAKDLRIFAERTDGRLPPLYAETLPLEFLFVENHNSAETIRLLKERNCTIAVNLGTPRILSEKFLDSFEAVLNCHPGILPGYRGCTAVEWSVYNDDPIGNTVHLMTAGIDEGPILVTEEVRITKADDYVRTRVKVYKRGFDLLAETTLRVISGDVDVRSLPAQSSGRYWKPIDDEKMETVMSKLKEGTYRYQSEDPRATVTEEKITTAVESL